jgi:ZIP family zinc transporter
MRAEVLTVSGLTAAGWGALGAASLLLGAWFAIHLQPRSRTVGLVLGFGAGALLGAVAYELVPTGSLRNAGSFVAFGAGAAVFFLVDRAVTGRHQPAAGSLSRSIVLGALLDGIPESLVLGMSIAADGKVSVAFLAAVFMSNLPEALGATDGMRCSGQPSARIYRTWAVIVIVSAVCAAVGYRLLRTMPHADGTYVEAFAAGAVLTMLANSMMPEALREGGRWTGLLTALGFAVAGALTALE